MNQQTAIDTLRKQPVTRGKLLIGGQWVDAESGLAMTVTSPVDGQPLATIASASVADVERAVQSARRAFDAGAWSGAAPAERRGKLLRLAELIEADQLALTVLGCRDNGTEFSMAYRAEPGSAAATFRYYAEAVDKCYGEIAPTGQDTLGLVHRAPVGVVGVIVPWNFPLMIGAWKLAPALAAGNTVVLKPSEHASLSSLRLAELALEAGLPEGTLNVVTGKGSVVGEALGLSMGVDLIAFTGSGAIGRRLHEYAARSNLKRLYLELGGKSPNIVFADAPDMEKAVRGSLNGIFRNSGQVCVAGARLLVQREIADEFTERLVAAAEQLVVGDPLNLASDIGAVTTEEQLRQNLRHVEDAIAEGAHLATGGQRILQESGGYYMQPTVFTEMRVEQQLAQEEIFGPVLGIMPFDDAADAVRLANASDYGLAAGVWSSNLSTVHRMIGAIRAGVVHVNCYGGSSIAVPMGGQKQSGNGYDKSLHALDKFTNLKTAWVAL